MEFEHVEISVPIDHHVHPFPPGIEANTLRFTDLFWHVSRADGEIEAQENSVACLVVLEEAPALVAHDPEGIAVSFVAQAREIQILGPQFGMDEALVGLQLSWGGDCRE